MMSWLTSNSDAIIIFSAIVTMVSTSVLAVITYWYATLTNRMLKASDMPEVRVFLSQSSWGRVYTLDLCIQNIGTGFAHD